MKVNRDETIKKHLDLVALLTSRLSEKKLSIFQHSYDYLCFGNWEMTIGAGHKDRRFFWDGRDFILIVSDRKKSNLTQGGPWKIVRQLPIGEISEQELFEKVYSLATEIK